MYGYAPAEIVAGWDDAAVFGEGEELVLAAAEPPLLPLEVAPDQRPVVVAAPAPRPPRPARPRRHPRLVGEPVHHPRRERRRCLCRHCRGEQRQEEKREAHGWIWGGDGGSAGNAERPPAEEICG